MRFRVQINELNTALSLVSVVQPRTLQNQGAGYLVVISGTTGTIYSEDKQRKAKASFEVIDPDGDGAFIIPVEKASSIKYLSGYADFYARKEDDRYVVEYESESRAKQEFTTYDPLSIKPFDAEMADAKTVDVYPSSVLREGLNLLKGFVLPENDTRSGNDEAFKSIQLFDGKTEMTTKGNGSFFAADKTRAAYFYCEALRDKALAVHTQHLPTLLGFLAKCEGDVKLVSGDSTTYVVNSKGHVFGWSHQTKHFDKFSYYSLKSDNFVLRIPKEILVRNLRYIQSDLKKEDKIRLQYSHKTPTIRIIASLNTGRIESEPIGVVPVEEAETQAGADGPQKDFGANLNINQLMDLIEPMKGNEIVLRVALVNDTVMIRTIEEFYLNEQGRVLISPADNEKAYQCKVTRFMPSRK